MKAVAKSEEEIMDKEDHELGEKIIKDLLLEVTPYGQVNTIRGHVYPKTICRMVRRILEGEI